MHRIKKSIPSTMTVATNTESIPSMTGNTARIKKASATTSSPSVPKDPFLSPELNYYEELLKLTTGDYA